MNEVNPIIKKSNKPECSQSLYTTVPASLSAGNSQEMSLKYQEILKVIHLEFFSFAFWFVSLQGPYLSPQPWGIETLIFKWQGLEFFKKHTKYCKTHKNHQRKNSGLASLSIEPQWPQCAHISSSWAHTCYGFTFPCRVTSKFTDAENVLWSEQLFPFILGRGEEDTPMTLFLPLCGFISILTNDLRLWQVNPTCCFSQVLS